MVPSGKATTVWPARSRPAIVPDHIGQQPQVVPLDRDDLHQPRQQSQTRPVDHLGLGDESSRHDRTDREDVHPRHMPADHQDALKIANRPAGHRDSHAQATQASSCSSCAAREMRPGTGMANSGIADNIRTAKVARIATRQRDDHALTGRRLRRSDAAGVTRARRHPGPLGGHDAIPSAIAAAAPTDLSRRRYRVSARRLSSRAGKSPTPKSGSWAGSPHTWAPSLR